MVYGYIRVSTEKQTVDNQRFEIERDLISQRTKEALARRRSEGFALGRPQGRKSGRLKLSGHEAEIQSLINENTSKSAIARRFGVDRKTFISFLKNNKTGVPNKG